MEHEGTTYQVPREAARPRPAQHQKGTRTAQGGMGLRLRRNKEGKGRSLGRNRRAADL